MRNFSPVDFIRSVIEEEEEEKKKVLAREISRYSRHSTLLLTFQTSNSLMCHEWKGNRSAEGVEHVHLLSSRTFPLFPTFCRTIYYISIISQRVKYFSNFSFIFFFFIGIARKKKKTKRIFHLRFFSLHSFRTNNTYFVSNSCDDSLIRRSQK